MISPLNEVEKRPDSEPVKPDYIDLYHHLTVSHEGLTGPGRINEGEKTFGLKSILNESPSKLWLLDIYCI